MCGIVIDRKALDPFTLEQLDKKLDLERRFRPALTRLFNAVAADFRAVVAATGQAPDARNFQPDFNAEFRKHYKRTQKAFKGDGRRSLEGKQVEPENEQSLEELIAAALIAWRLDTAQSQANIVTNTNQIQMQDSITKARQQLQEDGEQQITNTTLALAATAVLRRFFKARIERIIVTETQNAAESTRQIEAEALSGRVPFPLARVPDVQPVTPLRLISKTWVTVGDTRVRPSHVAMDDRTIAQFDFFVVGPSMSRMRYPGDPSQGAAAAELINCRCSSRYQLLGTEEQVTQFRTQGLALSEMVMLLLSGGDKPPAKPGQIVRARK
jgi:hypothetical protein